MKSGDICVLPAILAVVVLSAGQVQSAIVEIAFEAAVTEVYDGGGQLADTVGLGDSLRGTYCYDTSTVSSGPDLGSASSTVMLYEYDTVPYGVTLTGNRFSFATDSAAVEFEISAGWGDDIISSYSVFSWVSRNNISLLDDTTVGLIRFGASGRGWTSVGLPDGPLDLSVWDSARVMVSNTSVPLLEDWFFRADVTSMQVVPEPGTVVILSCGMLLLRRRRLAGG